MINLLSPLISDSMIIQRDFPFPLRAGKKFTAVFLGKTYEAKETDGKWLVTLDPVSAGGPFEMEISCDEGSFKIKDIYSGDLWLCSGQSNMELMMDRLRDDYGEEWDSFNVPNLAPIIRQFKVPQEWDFSGPRFELTGGSWLTASEPVLNQFSATAWFFAKNLYQKYRVPIGLIGAAWGGTMIETWMSEEALADFPQIIAEGKQYADPVKCKEIADNTSGAIENWEKNLSREDLGRAQNWQSVETDISSWKEMSLPGNFSNAADETPELKNFCGSIWLVKEFDAPNGFINKNVNVWLGTIVDADKVFINGVEIGNTAYRYPPRKYSCNGLIKQGKNHITIRVTCVGGEGSVTDDKQFKIFADNSSVELRGKWKYKIGAVTNTRPGEFFFQRYPMGNFNAMIAPVLKFPLKGVIWYQGESNEANPHNYAKLFEKMIQDWRKRNREDLPFMFVQLPIFQIASDNNENCRWPILREAQSSALSIPFTGMAAALEAGEWNDIHPINKKDVGYRLFLAADKVLFGAENTSPGPMLDKIRNEKHGIINNKKVTLYFSNCGGGLIIKDFSPKAAQTNTNINKDTAPVPYLSVIGSEGQFRLPITIEEKDCISVDVSSVKNPERILYAWADNPRDRQLYNSEGLPMIPFRIILNKDGKNV